MTLFKQSALAAAVCLALAPAAFAQQTSGSSTPAADTSTSSMGSTAMPSSGEVRQVQQHLKDKGVDVGAIDGVMGPKTRSALKSFQQQQGLTASGDIDASTLTALGVEGGGSTMDSSSPPAGGAAPGAATSPSGATGGSSSTPSGASGGTSSSPSNTTGGSSSSTSPSGGTGSTSSSPSDSGTSSGTMPKK